MFIIVYFKYSRVELSKHIHIQRGNYLLLRVSYIIPSLIIDVIYLMDIIKCYANIEWLACVCEYYCLTYTL